MKPELLKFTERIVNKPILLMSDFDMTLASRYVFSEVWQTHVPIIDKELVTTLHNGSASLCIATARGALEPVSWMIGHSLLSDQVPLVVENGAALLWNRQSVSTEPSIELLVTDKEAQSIATLQQEFKSMMSDVPDISKDHRVGIRSHRIASIEVRAEHHETHIGTPDDYPSIVSFLITSYPTILDHFSITTTGSSLTIEPKSVNKRTGILAALNRANIDVQSVFPIGIGDNKNDTHIFSLARELGGIAIGVSKEVEASVCDLLFDEGAISTKRVIQHIQPTKL